MIVRRVLASVPHLMPSAAVVALIAVIVSLIALIVYVSVIYLAWTAIVVLALIDPGPE